MDSTTETTKNSFLKDSSKESIDLTTEDTDISASNDTILQLSQDLAFLQKDFNGCIQLTNKKSNEENASFLENIGTATIDGYIYRLSHHFH